MTKKTNYPEALDTNQNLPDITAADRMNQAGLEHDVQHTTINQAVIELQKKVGKDLSEDQASLDWRVKNLEDNGGGGSGGAGLEISSGIALPGNLPMPALAETWLEVTIDGLAYAVPGFLVKQLEPPTQENAKSAQLFYPTIQRAHAYIPIEVI